MGSGQTTFIPEVSLADILSPHPQVPPFLCFLSPPFSLSLCPLPTFVLLSSLSQANRIMADDTIHKVTTKSSSESASDYGETKVHQSNIGRRIWDSFKPNPNSLTNTVPDADVENAAENTANSPLERRLKGRHMQMIAIGGSIGAFSYQK